MEMAEGEKFLSKEASTASEGRSTNVDALLEARHAVGADEIHKRNTRARYLLRTRCRAPCYAEDRCLCGWRTVRAEAVSRFRLVNVAGGLGACRLTWPGWWRVNSCGWRRQMSVSCSISARRRHSLSWRGPTTSCACRWVGAERTWKGLIFMLPISAIRTRHNIKCCSHTMTRVSKAVCPSTQHCSYSFCVTLH